MFDKNPENIKEEQGHNKQEIYKPMFLGEN